MGKVYGETVAANPHEELVREHCCTLRNNPVSNILKLNRPSRPLPVLSRVARHIPAEDDEECGRNTSSLDTAVDEFAEALLGAKIAENDTVEELALESF